MKIFTKFGKGSKLDTKRGEKFSKFNNEDNFDKILDEGDQAIW